MNKISYLITDSSVYSSYPTRFKVRLLRAIKRHNPAFILYREKENFSQSMALWIKRRYGQRVLVHSHIKLARRYRFFGVHLPSNLVAQIPKAKRSKLFVVASAHSLQELHTIKKLGGDMATFSPIFATPNKGMPKGVRALKKVVRRSRLPILALGGIIRKKEVAQITRTKAVGFASIRYFSR